MQAIETRKWANHSFRLREAFNLSISVKEPSFATRPGEVGGMCGKPYYEEHAKSEHN